MVNAYANMSVPPTSRVVRRIEPPRGPQLAFRLAAAAPADAGGDRRDKAALAWFRQFVREHADEIAAAAPPRRFAIARVVPDLAQAGGATVCTDPALAASVVGRIAGTLYVPGRPVRLGPEHAGRWFVLPRSDFPAP